MGWSNGYPTSPMNFDTIGRNSSISFPDVLSLKYMVAGELPPVKILRASSKFVAFRASQKIVVAFGATASAARLMPRGTASVLQYRSRVPVGSLCGFAASSQRRTFSIQFLECAFDAIKG